METATVIPGRPVPAAVDAQPKTISRLLFVDNIRVFLTVLVILHHIMIIYSGNGSWIYNEGREDAVTEALGAWFCSVNQAYFMGLFLFISAYFVPGSYDRKGAGRFLKDRLIRLGIPLVLYSWVIRPVFIYLDLVTRKGLRLPFWDWFPGQYFRDYGVIGGGPLWFIETLLIFSAVYVLWRLLARPKRTFPVVETRFPGNGSIVLFGLLLGVASFLVRLWHPVDWSFRPLNLQFPHFAQYIALFVVGLLAYRRNWLLGLPEATGRRWLAVAVLMILSFPPLALASGAAENDVPFKGGWHWQALFNALWESFLCLSMCIGLIYAFRRYGNRQGRLAGVLSRNAYAAYLIHEPVITVIALVVSSVALYPLLKFALVALAAIPLCFGLSSLIRKLPYTNRVL